MKRHLLLRAAFGEETERTPVWFMRQAGRYLPEYRAVRAKAGGFLNLCRNPELAAEVSLQPLELVGVDGVIMFSDILTPLCGMGIELDFVPHPVIANPIQNSGDIERLRLPDPDENTPYVGQILRILRKKLADRAPLLGFAGAPFTLCCYLLEGGTSKSFIKLKSFLHGDRVQAHKLLQKVSDLTVDYLNYQIEHGAQMVQLFDTWAGILDLPDYQDFALPYVKQIFERIDGKGQVPRVYYIKAGGHLLEESAKSGADMLSLDWRVDIAQARRCISSTIALQGNLDPGHLMAPQEFIAQKIHAIIDGYGDGPGHVFNLGHGVEKETPPENARFMVEEVKRYSALKKSSPK